MESNNYSNSQKESVAVPIAIIVSGFLIAASIYLSGTQNQNLAVNNNQPVNLPTQQAPAPTEAEPEKAPLASLDYSKGVVVGNASAPITMVEYSDFQCPFCVRWAQETLPELKSKYIDTGKVKFVFKHAAFHGEPSYRTAQASMCANDQGKFLEMHDKLYGFTQAVTKESMKSLGAGIVGDLNAYNNCIDSDTHYQAVMDETNSTRDAGVDGTPTFFIGKSSENNVLDKPESIVGAQPTSTFTASLDKWTSQ